MIQSDFDPDSPFLVADIGNTHVSMARWARGEVTAQVSSPTSDDAAIKSAMFELFSTFAGNRPPAISVASVVPSATSRFVAIAKELGARTPLIVGDTIPLPMDLSLRDPRGVGADRVCAAAGAYDRLHHACAIVDFGTAITVDLVNEEGEFLGGAILPGMRLQLKALHEQTAALPLIEPGVPEMPYGGSTSEAIQTGVCRGIAGAVRGLIEGYATSIGRWPQTVATGGDAIFFANLCDFLDSLVPDLTLRGVGLAFRKHLEERGA